MPGLFAQPPVHPVHGFFEAVCAQQRQAAPGLEIIAQRVEGARVFPAATMIQKIEFAPDSPLEGKGFELVWGFSCQVVIFGL